MSGNVDNSNPSNLPKLEYTVPNLVEQIPEPKAEQLQTVNTIFDIDIIGNNNGELEEEDFLLALSQSKYRIYRNKIEQFYVEFAEKHLGKQKEVGNYLVTELDMPMQSSGVTNRKKIFKDKETGRFIMSSDTIITEKDGITTVKTNKMRSTGTSVTQHEVEFQYNKEALENYIINEAKDANGNRITYFSEISNIRQVPENLRSEAQKDLLNEFNTFVKIAIDSGVDYGMDPKFIVAIIQQEVGFKGLAANVTGKNGKGYMQLTSAPIKDFLGYAADGKYHNLKVGQYGPEMEELLISRGFDTSVAGTTFAKANVYRQVYNYLTDNKDPDFNIRLGTLVLRYYTDRAKGNVRTAARNYNGSPLKDDYARYVSNFNNSLADTVPRDTTYVCNKFRL